MIEKATKSERWKNIEPTKKFVFWACAASIALTILIGFKWGGWVTGGTAQEMAERAADEARVDLAVASCIVRFGQGSGINVRLAKLKKTDSWDRANYMEKAGWVTPVGTNEPVRDAGAPCAEILLKPKAKKVSGTPN
jgi:hypothetical protein